MRARPEAVEAVPRVWSPTARTIEGPDDVPVDRYAGLAHRQPGHGEQAHPAAGEREKIVAPPRRSHRYEPPIAPGRATLPQPKDVPAPSCSMLTVEVNVATTLIGPDTGIEQMGSSPVQPPLQPVNADAESGAAVRSIVLPAANVAAHIVPHVIPVGRT